MPRVPDNTQTRTPTLLKRSAQVPTNGLMAMGGAYADAARIFNVPIRHEHDVRSQNVADANAKLNRINTGIKGLTDSAHTINKVMNIRAETEARRHLSDLQEFLTMNETGYNRADGTRVPSVYEVPYNPGSETGDGMSGATTEMARRVKEWSEGREITGRTLEFYQRNAEAAIDRSMARARNVDGQKHAAYKKAVNEKLFASQRDVAAQSGTVEDISTAAATGAILSLPREFVANYDEWMRDPVKDPAELVFTTPQAEKTFKVAYADLNDKIATDVVNRLVMQAVQSDDDEQANTIFDAVEENEFLTKGGEAGGGGGLWAEVNQLKAKELVERGRAERTRRIAAEVSMMKKEGYDVATMAALGTWKPGMSEEEKSAAMERLDVIRQRLPGDEALKMAQYQVGLAEEAELFYFDQERLEVMKDATVLNLADKMNDLLVRANGIKSPGAREKAIAMVSKLSTDPDEGRTVTKEKAKYDLVMGGLAMKDVYNMRQAGQIDNVSFGRYVEASRELAEEAVDRENIPERVVEGLESVGFSVKDIVPVTSEGAMRFDSKNRFQYPIEPGRMAKVRIDDDKVKLSNAVRYKTLELAIEFETQRKQGLRKESFVEYFMKKIVNEHAYFEWTSRVYEERINKHYEKIMAERDVWYRAGYRGIPLEDL